MGNASKALLMAGGVLIAILILTLIVYVYLSMSSFRNTQNMKRTMEEVAKFNREYEAYNKTRLYGTEIITVIKKAIDYNQRLDTTDKINIILTTKQDFKQKTVTITYNDDGTTEENTDYGDEALSIDNGRNELLRGNQKLNTDFVGDFKGEKGVQENRNGNEVTYTYSSTYEFGRAIFKCTEVLYDSKTGKINSMSFEQLI